MSKTFLYQMKLADSVMKETQRFKPLGVREFPSPLPRNCRLAKQTLTRPSPYPPLRP